MVFAMVFPATAVAINGLAAFSGHPRRRRRQWERERAKLLNKNHKRRERAKRRRITCSYLTVLMHHLLFQSITIFAIAFFDRGTSNADREREREREGGRRGREWIVREVWIILGFLFFPFNSLSLQSEKEKGGNFSLTANSLKKL